MRDYLAKIEGILLSTFPLLFCLTIFPSPKTEYTFYIYKTEFLLMFIIFIIVLRLAVNKDMHFYNLGEYLKKVPLYIISLAMFLVFLLISIGLSADISQAVFGTANFHTGAYFITLSAIIFWIYSSGRKVSENGIAILIIIFSAITILEYIGFRPLYLITDVYKKLDTSFPAVTVGYRGQVSGVSILLSLLPLYWFRGRYTDWQFWVLFVIGCIGLGSTTNSSATAGFAVAIIIFVLASKKTMLTVILIPLVAFVSLNTYRPLTQLNAQLYVLGWVNVRSDAKDIGSTVTLKTRLILWEAGLRMFAAKPIFGWGPQTYNHHWFNYVSKVKGDQLYRLELSLKSNQKLARVGDVGVYKGPDGKIVPVALNYTTPHSAIVDLLYSQGMVGFLCFSLFLFFVCRLISKRFDRVVLLALLPLIGYFIYLGAWFITVPATGLAAIILGMAVSDARNTQPDKMRVKEVH